MPGLLDILFPPSCIACEAVLDAGPLCGECELGLEPLPAPRCARCAEPGDFGAADCPRCQERPPPFTRAFAPFAHQGSIARAIHLFKYEDRPELAAPLAALAVRHSAAFLAGAPHRICALPLHARRFRERRYDQAELLVAELCKLTGRAPLAALERWRETRRQVGLHESEREENVRGAFRARRPLALEPVLLVDDVLTTGATARAAAAALREAGASEVQVLALARAFAPP